jgi:hypothetical protein
LRLPDHGEDLGFAKSDELAQGSRASVSAAAAENGVDYVVVGKALQAVLL